MATLSISRDSGYTDRFRAYNVLLDNQKIGEIRDAETREFTLEKGEHTLLLTIDWACSNTLTFRLDSEQTVRFRVASSVRGWNLLNIMWYITFRRNRYLRLERAT